MTMHSRSDRKNPGIKRPFLQLPETLEGEQSYCITIPGGLGNKKVLLDLLQMAVYWFSWERSEGAGTEGKQAADAWRDKLNLPELKMCCCPEPTNQRYTAEGVLEVSYDNGATWVTDPSLDSRHSGIISPPLSGDDGAEKACIGATAAVEYIKQNLIDDLATGMTFAELNGAGIALAALLGVTGVGLLIAAFAAAVFLAGVAATQAAFTSEVWTDFRCILLCHIEDDASFTADGWEGVKADTLSTFTGIVSAVLYNWVNSVGEVGLTNAARSNFAASGDCDDCDPCENCSNLDNWNVQFGTILEQTPGYIRLASADNGVGQQACRINNFGGAGAECCAVTYNIISGVATNQAYLPCGSSTPVFSVPPPDTCMWDINVVNVFFAAMEIEFFFSECP